VAVLVVSNGKLGMIKAGIILRRRGITTLGRDDNKRKRNLQ